MRQHVSRSFLALLCVSALVALHVAVPSDHPREAGDSPGQQPASLERRQTFPEAVASTPSPAPPLCVVVPYRERPGRTAREPERFAAYLRRWLQRVKRVERVRIWLVEQEDEQRFNRGWLLNIGVALGRAVDGCDVFALHDVDLLPVDPRIPYTFDTDANDEPIHLSPPGAHPEYCYPTFRGGAWLFSWRHLLDVNGYSHAYWGWGQEDDDLGARMRDANMSHGRAFQYPGARPTNDGELIDQAGPCTGRVAACDHDPIRKDCGVYPYARFVKHMFHPTPGGKTADGIVVPRSRSLAEGVCFVHAHEGGFSRDAVEVRPDLISKTSDEFQRGRRWADVIDGRFRRDEATGLAGLVPTACSNRRPQGSNSKGLNAAPAPGHGFQVLAVDKIGVVVGVDGVADKVRESVHPAFASWLSSTTGRDSSVSSVGSRWSGNAFLDHVCDEDTEYPYAYDPSANEMSAGAYTRVRVRLTCDQEEAPWCLQPGKPPARPLSVVTE